MFYLDRGGNWCRSCGRFVKKEPGIECRDCQPSVCEECDPRVRADVKVIKRIVRTASLVPVGGK